MGGRRTARTAGGRGLDVARGPGDDIDAADRDLAWRARPCADRGTDLHDAPRARGARGVHEAAAAGENGGNRAVRDRRTDPPPDRPTKLDRIRAVGGK